MIVFGDINVGGGGHEDISAIVNQFRLLTETGVEPFTARKSVHLSTWESMRCLGRVRKRRCGKFFHFCMGVQVQCSPATYNVQCHCFELQL